MHVTSTESKDTNITKILGGAGRGGPYLGRPKEQPIRAYGDEFSPRVILECM